MNATSVITRHPPRFVYLASSTSDSRDSIIGDATNPWLRVATKNRHNARDRWRIELVVGPFFELASRFKTEWIREETSLRKRIWHGCWKARHWRVGVYARDPDWITQMLSHSHQKSL